MILNRGEEMQVRHESARRGAHVLTRVFGPAREHLFPKDVLLGVGERTLDDESDEEQQQSKYGKAPHERKRFE
jgi:hypothetical protein